MSAEGKPETFMSEAARQLEGQLAGFSVRPDPGMITVLIVDPDGTKVGHVSAQREYEACRTASDECARRLSNWTSDVASAVKARMITPKPDSLRVMLTRRRNLEQDVAPRAPNAPQLLVRTLLSDLVYVAVAENGGEPRVLDARYLTSLNFTEEQVFSLALANTRRQLKPPGELPLPTQEHPIQTAKGSLLESSSLLLTEEWAKLAARLGDELIVAAPSANQIAYARGDSPAAIAALGQFAASAYPVAERPVATKVLRWRASGWEVAAEEAPSAVE